MRQLCCILTLLTIQACKNDGTDHSKDAHQSAEIEDELVSSEKGLIWHYDDEFEASQQDIYERWLTDVHEACTVTLGEYPFDMNVHFHKSSNRSVPVSFGHTRRNEFNELHFYVNPEATYNELIADWTAQHEVSHHSIPFVGKKFQWFSEGYATYMSRRIMILQGFYTEESFDSLYLNNIIDKKRFYSDSTLTFSEASAQLFKQSNYGAVYWAGSGFFYKADQLLQEHHNMRMEDVIKKYQDCCRLKDKNYRSVIRSFDEIIDSDIFTTLSDQYTLAPCTEVMADFN